MIHHRNQWYRFLSHAFLHADWSHLIVNMLVLYFFGLNVETNLRFFFSGYSTILFLILYFGGIVAASATTYFKHKDDYSYNSVGASGAVSALLFSSVVFDPWNKIYLYGIIGLPGIVWAVIYVGYSYYMGQKQNDNINHDAHLWGGVFGLVFSLIIDFDIATRFFDLLSNPQF
jgi:membrane associated rhomboid family serine protease